MSTATEQLNGNGNGHPIDASAKSEQGSALVRPQVESVPLDLLPASTRTGDADTSARLREDYFAGGHGEERRDYAFLYNQRGEIVATAVYFYGADQRATSAGPESPLVRRALYQGKVNPFRLHSGRKTKDVFYVGARGQERTDRHICYHANGEAARTIVFYYEGDARAQESMPRAPLRRAVAFAGRCD